MAINSVGSVDYSQYMLQPPKQVSGGQAVQQAQPPQPVPQGPAEENQEGKLSQSLENTTGTESTEMKVGIDTYA